QRIFRKTRRPWIVPEQVCLPDPRPRLLHLSTLRTGLTCLNIYRTMFREIQEGKSAMADNSGSPANSAPIGYRRPPPGFAKGQSGNPAGRPKGAKNKPRAQGERLRSLMLEEAYRPVKMSEDGAEITLPLAQAVFRTLAAAAAKGDARAQATFLKLVSATEDAAAAY